MIASLAPSKENGFYVVLLPPAAEISEMNLAAAAPRLQMEVAELTRIFQTREPVPLIRLSTLEAAAQVSEELRALDIESAAVPHKELQLDSQPKRVRAVEISDEGLKATLVGSPETPKTLWEDVILLVVGRLIVNRIEVQERRKRGRNQPMDQRQISSDETVLDICLKSERINWRVSANNFDFSCLGPAKATTAYKNFSALVNLLLERATKAAFDDSYARLRPALATVWPVEPLVRKGEWGRSSAGKIETATVTTIDNETQFTRYARLRRWLKLREMESSG